MNARILMMAAGAAALVTVGAWAQPDMGEGPAVVRGGTVVVTAPRVAGYVTQQDAALVKAARTAIETDAATKSALVSLIANNGELTVVGTTADASQSTRVVMKLKKVPGTKKVYAFIDPMSGDSGQ